MPHSPLECQGSREQKISKSPHERRAAPTWAFETHTHIYFLLVCLAPSSAANWLSCSTTPKHAQSVSLPTQQRESRKKVGEGVGGMNRLYGG